MFTVQVRKPGKAYKSVETCTSAHAANWVFQQHLSPDGINSVRVLNVYGAVIVRATPRVR